MRYYKIVSFKDPIIEARFTTLGIYPGKILKIIRKGFFGGAYYVEVDQCHFALRESEIKEMELRELINGIEK